MPYVNYWGVEDVCRYRLAPDRHVGGRLAVFLDDEPTGSPDFTRQHMARQRECMMAGLCQVCGRLVPWSRRWLVVADVTTAPVRLSDTGREATVISEPWLCERCARFAINHCPALIRRRRTEQLLLVPVINRSAVQLIYSTGFLDPPAPCAEESRRMKPVLWVKIALAGVSAAGTRIVVAPPLPA